MPQHDLDWLLEHLEGVEGSGTQYSAWCPVHADFGTKWKGLSITLMGDKILAKCHSCGATLPAIERALENGGYDGHIEDIPLTIRSHSGKKGMAWWVEKTGVPANIWAKMDCVEEGSGVAFLFDIDLRKIRKPPKDISWQPAGADCPPLWPTVEDELPTHIWITEGESDAGTARAAGHCAFAVTKGSKTAMPRGWVKALASRGVEEITVCGDTDEPGIEFAESLVQAILESGLKVNRVHLEDVIDGVSALNDLNGVYRACATIKEFKKRIAANTHPAHFKIPHKTGTEWIEFSKQEPEWILPGLISPSDKVLVSGPQKAYKTTICLDLMRSLTQCTPFLQRSEWTPEQPHKSLYVQEEGSPYAWGQRVKRGQFNDDAIFLHRYGVRFTDSSTISELISLVRYQQIETLFLDPLQRMIPGVNENDSSETGIVWDQVARLQLSCPGLVVIVVHHAKKGEGLSWESIRGSSRHGGEVDLGIFVQKHPEEDNTVQISVEGRDLPPYLGTGDAFTGRVEITDDNFVIDAREIRTISIKPQAQGQRTRERVLSAIQGGCHTRTEIKFEIDASDSTVIRALNRLIEQDMVVMKETGEGKPNNYFLKESDADGTADPDGD